MQNQIIKTGKIIDQCEDQKKRSIPFSSRYNEEQQVLLEQIFGKTNGMIETIRRVTELHRSLSLMVSMNEVTNYIVFVNYHFKRIFSTFF